MRLTRLILIHSLVLFFGTKLFAQDQEILEQTNRQELLRLAQEWKQEKQQILEEARKKAASMGLDVRQEYEDGTIIELQGMDDLGNLLFYRTGNKDAARTTSTDHLWPGGSLGLSLTGDSMTVGVWEGGEVLTTHQELIGRVNQVDTTFGVSNHATHVSGTIIASGVDSSALGMAYEGNVEAYDWSNDDSEMAAAAANGMLISNHSYGFISGWRYNSSSTNWEWWGDTTLGANEDFKFGRYSSQSQAWDQIARNAPYYLICKSAGNDRGDSGTSSHFLPLHSAFSSTPRDADGGSLGYDCVSDYSGAKNILTVGAVNAIPAGYSGASSVVMSSFSGWGPTDDGRIKPDIVANGVGVYSSLGSSNSAYASWNGTSMATPAASGSLILLQQHYHDLNSQYMKAATLKALAIHTADEAGPNAGPDYMFGWGLLNTSEAAEHISDTSGVKSITETTLANGNTYSFNITVNGFTPIKATICWTDVAGTPATAAVDASTLMLVNDLDIRIIRLSDSTTFFPYTLNPASPASAASTGDNSRDNVEQIYLAAPSAGSYAIQVTHKGTLSGGSSQDFSLILDGGLVPAQPLDCDTIVTAPIYWDFDTLTNCSTTAGAACNIPSWYGWQNDTIDDIDWTVDNGGTTSSPTGPNRDFSTGTTLGKYLYTEASGSGTGYPNKQAILYSPCINLDTISNPELAFAYHMYGSTMGTLNVEVYNGYSWNQVWSLSGDQDTSWHQATVDLGIYAGDTIQIRFVGITGSSFYSDMAIDAVQIRELVTCPAPDSISVTNITDTTALFSWSTGASFHRIQLDIRDSITLIAPTTINFNPVQFINLIPNTEYAVYVQDSCGANDTSEWVGPIYFTTTGPILNPTTCGLNAAIPDNTCPGLAYLSLEVSAPGTQLGVDVFLQEVKLIIDHTYDEDLTFYLSSPAGDTVLLSAANGGSGDDYGNPADVTCAQTTNFNSLAPISISAGAAPFIGNYQPEESLSLLHTGSNPNGTWKFIICDGFSGDVGTLEYLELVFDTIPLTASFSCTQTIDSFPAVYDFDTLTNCSSSSAASCSIPSWYGWSNATDDDIDWKIYSGSTPSGSTGPIGDTTGASGLGKYMYVEASTNGTGFPNKQAVLYTPCFDLSDMTGSQLVFSYHMNGTTMGSLSVQALHLGAWSTQWTISGNQGNSWNQASVDLSDFDGDTIVLRFVGVTGTDYFSDIAIDGVEIREFDACPEPTGLYVSNVTDTTVIFGWSSTASFHRIRLDIKDSVTVIPPATINFNPVFFFNLIPNTAYDVYVQDSCTLDTSDWVGPFTFTTTGPVSNPTSCGLNASIPDNSCPNLSFLRMDVTAPGTSLGVDVQLESVKVIIDHTFDADLEFSLASPSGDTVLLSSGNGSGGDDYGNPLDSTCAQTTTFTMSAINSITSGSAPFIGSYRPEGDFSDFNDGSNPNGTWKFLICDNAGSDVGTLEFVELTFDTNIVCKPTVSISNSGTNDMCVGDSRTLTASTGIGYQWYKNGTMISGATNSTLVVNDEGLYNAWVDSLAGCGDSAVSGISITLNSLPTVSISNGGSSAFCIGNSTTLSTSGGSSYQWYRNGSVLGGAGSSSYLVTLTGNYNVQVTDGNGCSDTSSSGTFITVHNLPTVSLTAAGSTTFCQGDSVFLSTTSGGSSYQWYRDGNSIGGATAFGYMASQAGNYNLYITDLNNCSDSSVSGISVTVNALPNVTISSTGSTTFCDEDSVILNVTGFVSQQWYQGGNPIAGATSGSITVKTGGSYNAYVTDGNTCSDSSANPVPVTVNPLPMASVSVSDSVLCDGETASLETDPGYTYQWMSNGSPLAGANSRVYQSGMAGSYSVMLTDVNNCSDTSLNEVSIVVNDLPEVDLTPLDDVCNINPAFTLTGGSPAGGVYSGVGVSAGQFDPSVAGVGTHTIYYKFTDMNTCSDSANQDIKVINCTGIDENGNAGEMRIYPNPTRGQLNIEFDDNWSGEITLRMFSVDGALVIERRIDEIQSNSKVIFEMDEFQSGVYFLHVQQEQKKWIQKVILEQNF